VWTESSGDDMTTSGAGICVVVQFLRFVEGLWPFWEALARDLETQGQSLVILSPHAPPPGAHWPPVLPIPYAIGEYTAVAPPVPRAHWADLLEVDWAFHSPTHPAAPAPGFGEMASAQRFVDALLDHLQPDVVLAWAPPFPQSRLLLHEARWREVPAFGIERGFLPGTLTLESHDVGFGADIISHPALANALAEHTPDPNTLAALRVHAGLDAGVPVPQRRDPSRAPVVTLLGSCPGFNLQPRQSRMIQLASPWFSSFGEACDALADALPSGVRLRARPHQADVEGRRYCASSTRVEAAHSDSISDLVATSDVIAVVGGTRTQLEAVLAERPVLTLSRGPLWGAGVAYEFRGQDLRAVVRQALAREGWADRLGAGRRLVGFLAAHMLYAVPGVPLPRGAADLATFLGRFRLPQAAPEPLPRRLDRYLRATAPLLADYVTREVRSGARSSTPSTQAYLEAGLAETVRRAGIRRVAVYGAGVVGHRLREFLAACDVTVVAVVDRDPATHGHAEDGVPVLGPDALAGLTVDAVILATHAHEAAMRLDLSTRGVAPPLGVWGVSDYPASHAR
jgi:hypothetical protein